MTNRTISSEWDKFVTLVVPPNASQLQLRETRRAFYAGVEAALRLQFDIGDASVSEDQGIAMIEGWHAEIRQFAADLKAGRA